MESRIPGGKAGDGASELMGKPCDAGRRCVLSRVFETANVQLSLLPPLLGPKATGRPSLSV